MTYVLDFQIFIRKHQSGMKLVAFVLFHRFIRIENTVEKIACIVEGGF